MYLVTRWFGTFLFDENGNLVKKYLFPKHSEEIAEKLQMIFHGEILEEEKTLVKNHHVRVSEKRLSPLGKFDPDNPFFNDLQLTPQNFGYSTLLLHDASLLIAQSTIEEKLSAEDLQIIQMVNALDDLIQTSNLLSERLTCWMILPHSTEKLSPFKHLISEIEKEINRLQDQIKQDVQLIAPNITMLVGPLITARLIALAGNMQRLATLPASSIQLLGAEKALFRFKKEGGKPPKHGVIFQHPLINKAPPAQRGRLARALATKLAIAAKADVFTKRDISQILQKDLEQTINVIKNCKANK